MRDIPRSYRGSSAAQHASPTPFAGGSLGVEFTAGRGTDECIRRDPDDRHVPRDRGNRRGRAGPCGPCLAPSSGLLER